LSILITAFANVLPLFALIVLGILLRRGGLINEEFIASASRLVFKLALPVMVFRRLSVLPGVPPQLFGGIAIFAGVTAAAAGILVIALRRIPGAQSASAVQGAFRSNIAIVGLAVIESWYGVTALAYGAVVLALIMPLYNVLAVVVLSHGTRTEGEALPARILRELASNPLIWAVIVGLIFALSGLRVGGTADRTLEYLSRLTLPLALIGIGGSLSFSSMKHGRALWSLASAVKLVLLPALVFAIALVSKIEPEVMKVVTLAAACPTAVASFPMARAMGADAPLAGEIVSVTTLVSVLTLTGWMTVLELL
jgi:malonate transporter